MASPPRLRFPSPKRRRFIHVHVPLDEYEEDRSEDYNMASHRDEEQDIDSEGSDAPIQREEEIEEEEELDSEGSDAAIQGEEDLDSQGSYAALEREEEIEEEDLNSEGSDAAIQGEEDVVQTSRSVSRSPSCSSSQSVKLRSSDILDCPTCFEPLKRPIYQCTNGHVACSSCCTKLENRCPFCKSNIGDIRCRVLEKIIEASIVPCRNAPYGCNHTTSYDNQSSHEKLCVFVPCSCPLPDCNYTGSYKDLQSHAFAKHTSADLTPFLFDSPLNFDLDLDKIKVRVFQEDKEGDLIVLEAFKGLHGVFFNVSCIAPMAPDVGNLSCRLAKLNQRTTLRLGLMLKKIQKVSEQQEPKDDFMFVPGYMLRDGHLTMQICIGKEDKYLHI